MMMHPLIFEEICRFSHLHIEKVFVTALRGLHTILILLVDEVLLVFA